MGQWTEHIVTDATRATVTRMVKEKKLRREIAAALGISPLTLYNKYAKELGNEDKLNAGRRPRVVDNTEHTPTPESRAQVENLAAVGYDEDKIADRLEIGVSTLRKYYRVELLYGEMDMLGLARNGLAEALKAKQPWAICFVLKTRGKDMGWSERIETTGKNGQPIFDLSRLTRDELAIFEKLAEKVATVA